MKKLQVFVSSTIYDLEKERAKVVEAILDSGHIPVGMELLGGANTITSTIKKMIDTSDIFFLLIGGKYGSIYEKENIGFVEWEYRYAMSKNKPICVIVLSKSMLYRKAAEDYYEEMFQNGIYIEKIDVIKSALTMSIDIDTIAKLVRLSKQEVEEIISKLPAYEEPLAYGSLTEEQFNEEIEKAMEDIKAGRVYSAKEVEEEYDIAVANEAYKEYVESGYQSKPIEELWRELNKNFDTQ